MDPRRQINPVVNTSEVSVDAVNELRAERDRMLRMKQLRQAYGIDFYRPHWKQDKFHAAGHVNGRYCRTGNRGGKTKCGAAEDVAHLIGGRVWYRNAFDVMDGSGRVIRHHPGGRDHELVTLDEQRAFDTLPALLPRSMEKRRAALEALHRIISARGALSEESERRLQRIEALFDVRSDRPAPEQHLPA